jgi:20S proteasome alpha/beta subunit
LETEWKEGLTKEEGLNLAVKAVRSAIIRDIASGNGIDVVVISKGNDPDEQHFSTEDMSLK